MTSMEEEAPLAREAAGAAAPAAAATSPRRPEPSAATTTISSRTSDWAMRQSSMPVHPAAPWSPNAAAHTSPSAVRASVSGAPSTPTMARTAMHNSARPSYLDVSALSPQEYAAFTQWVDRIKPAHSRREGLLDEHAAVKFLRSELGISVEDEVSVRALGDSRQILTLFERLPMGIQRGHFYAMVRLAAWAQQGYTATHDLLFTQTTPPERRKRRPHARSRTQSRAPSSASVIDYHAMPDSRASSVMRAPVRQMSSDDVPMAPLSTQASASSMPPPQDPPELGYHKVVLNPSEPRVVRPMPVIARGPHTAPHAASSSAAGITDLPHEEPEASKMDSPLVVPAQRPSAPMPWQQVSPLIQASLNARSEFKKASRQSRPKTFTVLSSSSGQFERDKPHLLTGQEVPPQALSLHTKRRTTSANKLSSLIASQDFRSHGDAYTEPLDAGHTIAPKPSYYGRERGVLPAWLREQYEEGNVLYPPPDPADASVMSVYDALNNKASRTMNGSERAAASINRNTPFFPPHERDRERAELASLDGRSVAQYRLLNEETSVSKRASNESMGERGQRLHPSRSKGTLASKSQPWGTQFEAGTYAGFKSTPSSRDLRMQHTRSGSKRMLQYRPVQEFQPMLAPPSYAAPGDEGPTEDAEKSPMQDGARAVSLSRTESMPRLDAERTPRLARSQSQPMRQQSQQAEMQRFVLQDDSTRSGLMHLHERKSSGTFTYTPLARRTSQKMSHSTPRDSDAGHSTLAATDRAPRPLPPPPETPRMSDVSHDLSFSDMSVKKPRKKGSRSSQASSKHGGENARRSTSELITTGNAAPHTTPASPTIEEATTNAAAEAPVGDTPTPTDVHTESQARHHEPRDTPPPVEAEKEKENDATLSASSNNDTPAATLMDTTTKESTAEAPTDASSEAVDTTTPTTVAAEDKEPQATPEDDLTSS